MYTHVDFMSFVQYRENIPLGVPEWDHKWIPLIPEESTLRLIHASHDPQYSADWDVAWLFRVNKLERRDRLQYKAWKGRYTYLLRYYMHCRAVINYDLEEFVIISNALKDYIPLMLMRRVQSYEK